MPKLCPMCLDQRFRPSYLCLQAAIAWSGRHHTLGGSTHSPAETHEVAQWEDRARVIREAIRLAPEQVWTVEHGMGHLSVDKGDMAGSRQGLRCSESVRRERWSWSCPHS